MRPRIRSIYFRATLFVAFFPLLAGCVAHADKETGTKTTSKKSSSSKSPAKVDSKSSVASDPVPSEAAEWNDAILEAIERMPIGGGYSTGVNARDALLAGIAWEEEKPALRPKAAQPSFCSGATYMVFLVAVAQQQRAGRLSLTPEVWRALIVEGQADGHGVWGRWNANGPGTARLFHEMGLGTNFTDIKQAKPGDFMKIFWNDFIGSTEKGHSVVFLGTALENGQETVSFWSSNLPGGYGTKSVPRSKIRRMLFSRLEHPQKLEEVAKLPAKDPLLSSLEEKAILPAVAAEAVGLKKL